MITLTTEQAQQIEEALEDIVRVFKFETGTPVEALAVIRAARAQEQAEQDLDTCPGCGGVVDASYARGYEEGCKDFEALVLPTAIFAEREACAKVCEEVDVNNKGFPLNAKTYAAAIRARGQS